VSIIRALLVVPEDFLRTRVATEMVFNVAITAFVIVSLWDYVATAFRNDLTTAAVFAVVLGVLVLAASIAARWFASEIEQTILLVRPARSLLYRQIPALLVAAVVWVGVAQLMRFMSVRVSQWAEGNDFGTDWDIVDSKVWDLGVDYPYGGTVSIALLAYFFALFLILAATQPPEGVRLAGEIDEMRRMRSAREEEAAERRKEAEYQRRRQAWLEREAQRSGSFDPPPRPARQMRTEGAGPYSASSLGAGRHRTDMPADAHDRRQAPGPPAESPTPDAESPTPDAEARVRRNVAATDLGVVTGVMGVALSFDGNIRTLLISLGIGIVSFVALWLATRRKIAPAQRNGLL
jgi:hypothetical protein